MNETTTPPIDQPMTVYKTDGYGDYGHFTLEVKVFQERPINENDRRAIWKLAEELQKDLHAETAKLDPENILWKKNWLEKVRTTFAEAGLAPIWLEEMDNQYCGPKCCPHRVWCVVTTPRGKFTVGWRKRVIEIRWTDQTCRFSAERIFPQEDVTKDGKYEKDKYHYIHAWGYEKMQEYLKTLALWTTYGPGDARNGKEHGPDCREGYCDCPPKDETKA